MSQPNYHITLPGLLFAVSDNAASQMRSFMFYLIKNFHHLKFTLSDMKQYFDDDTKTAIQSVYYLINMGWIDIDESELDECNQAEQLDLTSLSNQIRDVRVVLSDDAGITVFYHGMTRHDADLIAAQNRECLDTVMRSRRWAEQGNHRPSTFSIDWKDMMLSGQIWHLGGITFSLTTPNDMPLQENHLCQLISVLTRRYYAK